VITKAKILVMSVALLMLVGNVQCSRVIGAATAEEAVQQELSRRPNRQLAQFQVLISHPTNEGVILVYTFSDTAQGQAATSQFGVSRVLRSLNGWIAQSGSVSPQTGVSLDNSSICYQIEAGQNNGNSYTIIYGRALINDVNEIEVEFIDGESDRTSLVQGAFVFFYSAASVPQKIRVFDAQGSLIEQILLVQPQNGIPNNGGVSIGSMC
jgi:hypothetical protein